MIVVTGGAGFIGSVLAKHISGNISKEILIVDKFTKTNKWKNILNLKFYDFMDRDEFIKKIRTRELNMKIDLILHMGACASTTETDVSFLMEQNFFYSKDLMHYAFEKAIPFIYASSASVYGDGENSFVDDDNLHINYKPLNPYGFSKWIFDSYVINNNFSKDIVGLRFFNVFGPNEYHKENMSSVIYKAYPLAKKEGVVRLFRSTVEGMEDGGQRRDFIYIKDIIKVLDFFINNKKLKGIFNVGTGKASSFNDLGKALLKSLDKEPIIEYFDMPENIVSTYQNFTQADLTKLRKAGYKEDFYSLENAIYDYVNNYLEKNKTY
jgi:ADP-L-glycero-D-manno-heptose 6-epimerase